VTRWRRWRLRPRRGFGLTWGPTGKTLEQIKKTLGKSSEPSWQFESHLDHYRAAKAWQVDVDRWDELSDEAKGLMVCT
jgi:hypothetical protein